MMVRYLREAPAGSQWGGATVVVERKKAGVGRGDGV
eukprot:SAG25_NODE_11130_length_313_cov_0.509346_1_plen_35_part_10